MDSRPGSEMELLSMIVFLLSSSQTRMLQKWDGYKLCASKYENKIITVV